MIDGSVVDCFLFQQSRVTFLAGRMFAGNAGSRAFLGGYRDPDLACHMSMMEEFVLQAGRDAGSRVALHPVEVFKLDACN